MTASGTAVGQAYVYGILAAGVPVPVGLSGVGEAPVETLPAGALQLVVGLIDPARFGLAADLLAHSTVVDRISLESDIVPMAVGTFIPVPLDTAAVERLTAADRRVRTGIAGAVQYSLAVRYREEVALAELVGEDREIARLRDRTRRGQASYADQLRLGELVVAGLERKARSDAERILPALGPVRAVRRRKRSGPESVVELAVLVDRGAIGAYEHAVDALAAQQADRMRFRLLGPQAPYDFVSGG